MIISRVTVGMGTMYGLVVLLWEEGWSEHTALLSQLAELMLVKSL
jgi:hypothetical protein